MSLDSGNDLSPAVGWGVLPPPAHGQSIMNDVTRRVIADRYLLTWCNPTGSTQIHEVGHMSPGKVLAGLRAMVQFSRLALRHKSRFLGYISPARGGIALYRDTVVWLCSVVLGDRTIVHIHTGEYGFLRAQGPLGRLQRKLLRHSDVWAQTESWRAEMDALGARRSEAMPNGVTCRERHGDWTPDNARSKASAPLHVIFLGNIAIGKGIDVFLEVVDPLLLSGSVRVTIGGATVDLETDQLVDDLVAKYPGSVSRLRTIDSEARCRLLRSADVLVFPSRYNEAPSLVVCEAMEHGVVPVVSDRGALPELVHAAGYVCSTVADYRRAVVRLSEDDVLRRTMSIAAHKRWSSRFSLESYTERLLQSLART